MKKFPLKFDAWRSVAENVCKHLCEVSFNLEHSFYNDGWEILLGTISFKTSAHNVLGIVSS